MTKVTFEGEAPVRLPVGVEVDRDEDDDRPSWECHAGDVLEVEEELAYGLVETGLFSGPSRPSSSRKETKAELLSAAADLGLEVPAKTTRDDLADLVAEARSAPGSSSDDKMAAEEV